MTKIFDIDEIFGDFDVFSDNFMKRIQREFDEIEKAVKSGKLKGEWDTGRIDEPNAKGYIIRGRFWSDQPLNPFEPSEPFRPLPRHPMPERPFGLPETAFSEVREPLTDVFEEEKAVKLYVELPGEEKDDIQLNVAEGKAEVKAKKFHKVVDIPAKNIDIEKASSKYKNGVLEVTIPRKEIPENEKKRIDIA